MEIEKVNFCQPDEKHYCLECCEETGCLFKGPIGNNKRGCTIHPLYENRDTSVKKRRPICESVNCWIGFSEIEKEKLLEVITTYKEPKFRMSKAKKDAGIN